MIIPIAHFDRTTNVIKMLFVVVLLVALAALAIVKLDLNAIIDHPATLFFGAVGLVGSPFLLFLAGVVIWQAIFGKALALWIQGDYLVYLHRLLFSIKCDQINQIELSTYGPWSAQCIVIGSGGRKKKIVPTRSLVETEENIIANLKGSIPTARYIDSRQRGFWREK
jgi:hypothetical protein